jgi:hypothetical protein
VQAITNYDEAHKHSALMSCCPALWAILPHTQGTVPAEDYNRLARSCVHSDPTCHMMTHVVDDQQGGRRTVVRYQ